MIILTIFQSRDTTSNNKQRTDEATETKISCRGVETKGTNDIKHQTKNNSSFVTESLGDHTSTIEKKNEVNIFLFSVF